MPSPLTMAASGTCVAVTVSSCVGSTPVCVTFVSGVVVEGEGDGEEERREQADNDRINKPRTSDFLKKYGLQRLGIPRLYRHQQQFSKSGECPCRIIHWLFPLKLSSDFNRT